MRNTFDETRRFAFMSERRAILARMTHTSKGLDKMRGLGQMLGAVPEFQAIRAEVRELLANGGTDEQARALAIERGREVGLINPRTFIPSLTRKLMRMDVRVFLRKLADLLADKAQGKRVGEVADELWAKVGVDDWWADYIINWAKDPKGEPGAMLPQFAGRVWTQTFGVGDEKVDGVCVIITPLSHPQELLKEAQELCLKVLPDGTWSRYGYDVEVHRILRLKLEDPDRTWGDVAEILLDEREPYLREMGPEVYREAKKLERERITAKAKRWHEEYADSFFDELYPDSD